MCKSTETQKRKLRDQENKYTIISVLLLSIGLTVFLAKNAFSNQTHNLAQSQTPSIIQKNLNSK